MSDIKFVPGTHSIEQTFEKSAKFNQKWSFSLTFQIRFQDTEHPKEDKVLKFKPLRELLQELPQNRLSYFTNEEHNPKTSTISPIPNPTGWISSSRYVRIPFLCTVPENAQKKWRTTIASGKNTPSLRTARRSPKEKTGTGFPSPRENPFSVCISKNSRILSSSSFVSSSPSPVSSPYMRYTRAEECAFFSSRWAFFSPSSFQPASDSSSK